MLMLVGDIASGPGDNPVDCWISGTGREESVPTGGWPFFLLEDEYLFECGHAIGRDGQKHSLIFTLHWQQAKRKESFAAPVPCSSHQPYQ